MMMHVYPKLSEDDIRSMDIHKYERFSRFAREVTGHATGTGT